MKIVRILPKALKQLPRINRRYIPIVILLAVIMIQLVLPSDIVLPRTRLGSINVGLKTKDEIRDELRGRNNTIKLKFYDEVKEYSAQEAGISIDVEETLGNLPSLSIKDKFIPFGPVIKSLSQKPKELVVKKDQKVLSNFSESVAKEANKAPIDARAEIKDGQVIIHEQVNGVTYSPEAINNTLNSENPLQSSDPVALHPEIVPPSMTADKLQPLKKSFMDKTSLVLRVTYGKFSHEVDQKKLSTWMKLNRNEATGEWSLEYDYAAINAQVAEWNAEYTVSPGITQVQLVDDVEVSRKSGAAGQTLDTAGIRDQIKNWLEKPVAEPLSLKTTVLAPKVVVTKTYTRSSAALKIKIDNWIAGHPGRYQVSVRELGGQGREASHNVLQQTVMASTYKTFLAFVAYRQSESGALDLNRQLVNDKTINQCIEVMIVNSDNDCAVALGRYIGWAKADQIIAAAGFQNILLNNYDTNGNLSGDKQVNAREQANFLAQLSAGSLINSSNTNTLLGYMKRQVYRSGIPAGSRGAVVADKVGFLDNYLHDVGIVYGSKSTYSLVIMSEGSSWTNIKDLSQAVYDFMNE